MDLIQEEKSLEASIYHYYYWKAIQSQSNNDENDFLSMSNHDEINDDDDKTNFYTTVGSTSSSSISDNINHPATATTSMMTAASSITDDDDISNSNNNKHLQNNRCNTRCKEDDNHISNKLTLSEKYRQIFILIQQYFPDVTKDHLADYETMMSTTVPEVHRRFIGYPQLLQDHLSLHSICHGNGVPPDIKGNYNNVVVSELHQQKKEESLEQQLIKQVLQQHQQKQQHQISFTPSITSKTSCIQQNDNYIKFGELNSNFNVDSNKIFDPDKIFDPKLDQIPKLNNIITKSNHCEMTTTDMLVNITGMNNSTSMNQNQFGSKICNKNVHDKNHSTSSMTESNLNFNNSCSTNDVYEGELNRNFWSTTIQNHNYPETLAFGATPFNSSSDNITNIGQNQYPPCIGTKEGSTYQNNVMMHGNSYLKQASSSVYTNWLSSVPTPTSQSALIISLPSQTQKAPDTTTLHQIASKQQQDEQEQVPTMIPGSSAWCLMQRQKLSIEPRKSNNTGKKPAGSKVTKNKIVNGSRVDKAKNGIWQLVHDLHQRDNDDDLMSHSSSKSYNILDKSSSDEEEHDDDEDSWFRTKRKGRKRKDPSFMTSRRKSEESTPKRVTRSLTNSLPDVPDRLSGFDLPPSRSKRYKTKPKSPIISNRHHQQRPMQEYQASFMKPIINNSSGENPKYHCKSLDDQSKQNIDPQFVLCVHQRFPMTFEGRFDLLKRYKDYYGHCRIEIPSPWDSSNQNHLTYSKLYHWLSSLSCCYEQQQKQQDQNKHQDLSSNDKSLENLGLFGLSEERIQRLRSIGFEFKAINISTPFPPHGDDII